ncbi:MAG: T9SS type A sorting domain-containing protein [Candidatus Kapabacteria bacterium]|nr:T9SS type A sorting domain-containing protein [Candidatus Kapabacteria bacterium]
MKTLLTTLAVLTLMLFSSIAYGNPDIIRQIGSGSNYGVNIYTDIVYMNGYYYFAADDGNGSDLWRTDGTFEGTEKVCEVNTNNIMGAIYNIIVADNTLYFRGLTPTYGWELWISNGNIGNGAMLKDINPGTGSSTPLGGFYGVKMGSYFYFAAAYTTVNYKVGSILYTDFPKAELYKTDGTSAGTVKVKDICSTCKTGGAPAGLTVMNNKLYFFAYDPKKNWEFWQSDGTSAGTILVKDINVGSGSSSGQYPTLLTDANNLSHIYFKADDGTGFGLWKSNGTSNGTIKVKSGINFYPSDDGRLRIYNDKLYFVTLETNQNEIWVSDGTTNGTNRLYDIGGPGFNGDPRYINIIDNKMYFSAIHPDYGRELWIYDFSNQSMTTIDINSGANSSNAAYSYNTNARIVELGDYVYFIADGGSGYQLYRLNKYDYNNLEALTNFTENPPEFKHLAVLDGKIIFSAKVVGAGWQLWIYDPNEGSPRQTTFDFFGNESNTKLSIKPNPAQDVLNISADFGEKQDVELSIFDVIGNRVISLNRASTNSINEQLNISNLAQGVYFVRLKMSTDIIIKKIVKN